MAKSKSATQAAVGEETDIIVDDPVAADVADIKAQIAAVRPPAPPRRPAIYKRMEGDPDSQFAGLWIETQSNLLGVETRVLASLTYWADIQPILAQYIRGWNIPGPYEMTVTRPAVLSATQKVTDENGEITPLVIVPERQVTEIEWRVLPAPMDAGPDVFDSIEQLTKTWIWNQVLAAPYKRDPDSGN